MSSTKKSHKKSCSSRTVNSKKNVRSMRGVPETNYGEVKKISSFSLTPTGLKELKKFSQDLNISTSELFERFARLDEEVKDIVRQAVSSGIASATTLEALHKP